MQNRERTPAFTAGLWLLALVLLPWGSAMAVSVGQSDTFSDGSLQGWSMGRATITDTHMSNITDGGPAGTGDNYLQMTADGTTVSGGRLTMFNQLQWTGDYTAAGVTAISMDLYNISSSAALNLRLAINGGFSDPNNVGNFIGGLFSTNASITLDSGSGWTHVVFSLLPADLTAVSGRSGVTGNDVFATLSNVLELRLINSATPGWDGTPVVATLGIDNITAVPVPPAALLFGSGLVLLLGRFRRDYK